MGNLSHCVTNVYVLVTCLENCDYLPTENKGRNIVNLLISKLNSFSECLNLICIKWTLNYSNDQIRS